MEILLYKDNEGNIYRSYDSAAKNREAFYVDCNYMNVGVDLDKIISKIDLSKIKDHRVSVQIANDDIKYQQSSGEIFDIRSKDAQRKLVREKTNKSKEVDKEEVKAEEVKEEDVNTEEVNKEETAVSEEEEVNKEEEEVNTEEEIKEEI